ncbi:MAG: bacteriohemerythrin [Negativicutes bacterium]|nr:bacteriohemerythrin [Negativicutes bacterium]
MDDNFGAGGVEATGIRKIDAQHERIVALLTDLERRIEDCEAERLREIVAVDIVKGLEYYINTHFETEQVLLDEYHYPEAAAHRAEHSFFVDRVKVMQKKLQEKQGVEQVSKAAVLEAVRFIRDWIVGHISASDIKYARFLKEQGVE